jgi:rare lipoprotein A
MLLLASLAACGMNDGPPGAGPHEQLAAQPQTSSDVPSAVPPAAEPVAPLPDPMRGMASWYGGGHQGKRTASGERFDRRALTAAHRTLPLHTCLSVYSPATGRRVEVRVNDRGPWVGGRILDLSEAAATAIGLRRQGVGEVVLSVCPILQASSQPVSR